MYGVWEPRRCKQRADCKLLEWEFRISESIIATASGRQGVMSTLAVSFLCACCHGECFARANADFGKCTSSALRHRDDSDPQPATGSARRQVQAVTPTPSKTKTVTPSTTLTRTRARSSTRSSSTSTTGTPSATRTVTPSSTRLSQANQTTTGTSTFTTTASGTPSATRTVTPSAIPSPPGTHLPLTVPKQYLVVSAEWVCSPVATCLQVQGVVGCLLDRVSVFHATRGLR